MKTEELEELLLRFGADLSRWPQDIRAAAANLVAREPEAARLHAEFTALERNVAAAVEAPPFGAAEIGKVLSALDAEQRGWRPTRAFWIAGTGASAISFAAGFALTLWGVPAGEFDAVLSLLALAAGQGEIGGLL